jgi:hypothetical protein
VLENGEGVSSLVLTGDGVHVVVDEPLRRIPEFQSRLAAAGISVEEVLQVAPSIEDLFVDSVSQSEKPA